MFHLLSLSISVALIFFSCKKAKDERNEANKPPVAIAAPEQVITLPTESISLAGSASKDPDGKIDVIYIADGSVNGELSNYVSKLVF